MEQEWQNDAGALTAQAIPQKDVEQACFHALGLVGRNCEYLEQHLARVGADEQTRQAVNDISAAAPAAMQSCCACICSPMRCVPAAQAAKCS